MSDKLENIIPSHYITLHIKHFEIKKIIIVEELNENYCPTCYLTRKDIYSPGDETDK